jgi:hypothetical protein
MGISDSSSSKLPGSNNHTNSHTPSPAPDPIAELDADFEASGHRNLAFFHRSSFQSFSWSLRALVFTDKLFCYYELLSVAHKKNRKKKQRKNLFGDAYNNCIIFWL